MGIHRASRVTPAARRLHVLEQLVTAGPSWRRLLIAAVVALLTVDGLTAAAFALSHRSPPGAPILTAAGTVAYPSSAGRVVALAGSPAPGAATGAAVPGAVGRARPAAVPAVVPGGTVVVDPANSWAVLVGIGTYDSPTHPTFGGLGDVAAFHQLLDQAGWSGSHIVILTDQQATAQNIRAAMSWLVAHSSPTSFSLFHYSGHVNQKPGHDLLWGVDNAFIPDDEFGSDLQALQGRAWIDVSGCEAADFDRGLSGSDRLFTGSSMADQKSYEVPAWHESVWTGLVVDRAMLQHQAAVGAVSVQDAVSWATGMAPHLTQSQQPYGPQYPYAAGGTGEWYLGPAVAPRGLTVRPPLVQPPLPPPAPPAPAPQPAPPPATGGTGRPAPCALLTLGLSTCH